MNLSTALITATPYFISRLQGSPLQNSFSSYLSLIFTTANFGFLIHSTATAKQVRIFNQVRYDILRSTAGVTFSKDITWRISYNHFVRSLDIQHIFPPITRSVLFLCDHNRDNNGWLRLIRSNVYRRRR